MILTNNLQTLRNARNCARNNLLSSKKCSLRGAKITKRLSHSFLRRDHLNEEENNHIQRQIRGGIVQIIIQTLMNQQKFSTVSGENTSPSEEEEDNQLQGRDVVLLCLQELENPINLHIDKNVKLKKSSNQYVLMQNA